MRSKILFLAGAPGAGKSTVAEARPADTLLLQSDLITKRAGPVYFGEKNVGPYSRWQLWTAEMDDDQNVDALRVALHHALTNLSGETIRGRRQIMIEGAVAGHPLFRSLLCSILETESGIHRGDLVVETFLLAPDIGDLLAQVRQRRRPQEEQKSDEFICQRSAAYSQLMHAQAVQRFTSSDACVAAIHNFFGGCC